MSKQNIDVEAQIKALISQMTLEEMAAQMVQAEQATISVDEVKKYNVGSILSAGGSAPAIGNTVDNWKNHINKFKQASLESRLGIPLLYGVDAVHGHNNVFGATIFPHNVGLGAADDEEVMEKMGEVVAKEIRATGIQWTFAPCLGNARNELWGRTYECFAETSDVVARLGGAFTKGIQGRLDSEEFLSNKHVLANAKHYIGEGYTVNGTNQGDVRIDDNEFKELLENELLLPYIEQVKAGCLTVMVSYNSVNGLKCHESDYLLNDVLKGKLNFKGLVVSDYNGVEQVKGDTFKAQIQNAVNSGVDLLMEPYSWKETISNIVELVNEGGISKERLEDAVSRILRVKFLARLFEEEIDSQLENSLGEEFGCKEHRQIAREAVRKSLTLLKNDKINNEDTAILALKKAKTITIVGKKADDIGSQCGGWTVSWQGEMGKTTIGTTILEGFKNQASDDVTIKFSEDGSDFDTNTDAVIVVLGENPYAETAGDRSATSLVISSIDRTLMEDIKDKLDECRSKNIPLIGLLITGRPVIIADYVDKFDAIVEAWLPGTEGEGVSDVLLGDYDFAGTLKFTWPWYAFDVEQKFDDEALVLFRRGTGLRKDGSSILSTGTQIIGEKPVKSEEELRALYAGSIDLSSTGYVLEAENYTADSYLVTTGNANNITYVDSFSGEWANAKWKVYIPKGGRYKLHIYIAAAMDSDTVDLYYSVKALVNDNEAVKINVPMQATQDMLEYSDYTIDATFEGDTYEFKLMNSKANGCDFRLDRIVFEHID